MPMVEAAVAAGISPEFTATPEEAGEWAGPAHQRRGCCSVESLSWCETGKSSGPLETTRAENRELTFGGSLLYWLLYVELFHYFPPFRIFRYLTFRTAFASLTALLLRLSSARSSFNACGFQIGQYIREEGPKAHQKKAGTPPWAAADRHRHRRADTTVGDLSNPLRLDRRFSTVRFAAIGFADD